MAQYPFHPHADRFLGGGSFGNLILDCLVCEFTPLDVLLFRGRPRRVALWYLLGARVAGAESHCGKVVEAVDLLLVERSIDPSD